VGCAYRIGFQHHVCPARIVAVKGDPETETDKQGKQAEGAGQYVASPAKT